MNWQTLLALIILVLLLVLAGGCKKEPGYEPEYQTSEFECEWGVNPVELAQTVLPEGWENNDWYISCPKCGGSPTIIRMGTVTIERKVGAVAEVPCKWYCSDCLYPLGTDWSIEKGFYIEYLEFDSDGNVVVIIPRGSVGANDVNITSVGE